MYTQQLSPINTWKVCAALLAQDAPEEYLQTLIASGTYLIYLQ